LKPLPCGHRCPLKCHLGACGECREVVVRRCGGEVEVYIYVYISFFAFLFVLFCFVCVSMYRCECGNEERRMVCCESGFKCDRVCNEWLSCGKHRCTRKCCVLNSRSLFRGSNTSTSSSSSSSSSSPSSLHTCPNLCQKLLNCRLHRCPQPCGHRAPCSPCLETRVTPYACPCGRTVVEPPIYCGQTAPPCYHPCHRVREVWERGGVGVVVRDACFLGLCAAFMFFVFFSLSPSLSSPVYPSAATRPTTCATGTSARALPASSSFASSALAGTAP
jgi:transcriptional repressor NF-X1